MRKMNYQLMMLEEYSHVYLHTHFLSMRALKEKGISL